MYRPAAERTRSKRQRAGSRRNKKHPITHFPVCPEPKVCRVHTSVPPGTPPMRVRLTLCEQRWVDDVRAGRRHLHGLTARTKRMNKHRSIMAVVQARHAAGGNVDWAGIESRHANVTPGPAPLGSLERERQFARMYGSGPDGLQTIAQHYGSGRVQTGGGDVWPFNPTVRSTAR